MKQEEKLRLDKVTDLGCIVCWKLGYDTINQQVAVHHLRHGAGVGMKSSNFRAIPLCPPHHQYGGYGVAYHAGAEEFEKNFGSEEELLALVELRLSSPEKTYQEILSL